MWLKLGAVLVRAGVITPEQLNEALRVQEERGGRLGTILVELKLVQVDVLGRWLGQISGFPIATAQMLRLARPDVVKLIPGTLAEEMECMPFRLESGVLHVAIVNPFNRAAIEALASRTRMAILLYVVPDVLFQLCLETHYGIVRPPLPVPASPPSAPEPAPSIPAAPQPQALSPPVPASPPPVQEPAPSIPAAPQPLASPAVPSTTLATGGVSPASEQEDEEEEEESTERLTLEEDETAPVSIPPAAGRPSVLTVDEAAAALATAATRDEVVDVLLDFTAGVLDSALLLVVRDGVAIGWQGRGAGIDANQVGIIVVPLSDPSLFQQAHQTQQPAGGALADNAAHRRFYQALKRSPPSSAVVVPVMLRDRVVNLLYADRLEEPDAPAAVGALSVVVRHTSAAYARILGGQRRSG